MLFRSVLAGSLLFGATNAIAAPASTGNDLHGGVLMMYSTEDIMAFRLNTDGSATWLHIPLRADQIAASEDAGEVGVGKWDIWKGKVCIVTSAKRHCFAAPTLAGKTPVKSVVQSYHLNGRPDSEAEPVTFFIQNGQF